MSSISPSLQLFITLSKIVTEHSRRFNGGLDGLGMNEFIILLHIDQAPEKMLRRSDLAEKMGLTASGVTRILAPMEKIGLIQREANPRDARVSFVSITKSGQRNVSETLDRAEGFAENIFPPKKLKQVSGLTDLLMEIGGTLR